MGGPSPSVLTPQVCNRRVAAPGHTQWKRTPGGSAGLWRQETAQLLLRFGSLLFALDDPWMWLSLLANRGPGKTNLGIFLCIGL